MINDTNFLCKQKKTALKTSFHKNHQITASMSKNFLFSFSFSIMIFNFSYSQEKLFFGKVVDDSSGKPITEVLITIASLNDQFTFSDVNGKFEMSSYENQIQLTFERYGYETTSVVIMANQFTTIKLSEAKIGLDEVTLITRNYKEKGIESLNQQLINSDVLQKNTAVQLGSALSQIDGVSFISTGQNIQLPVIHGLYGNRILILNNGFKHGFQNWGSDHAPEIDVGGADVIKVIKGAAAVKYGPDALGGAVVVENNAMKLNEDFYLHTTSSYQTNGKGYGLNTSFGEGKKNFSYHFGGSFNQIGDRRAPGYNLTNTGMKDFSFRGGLRYDYKDWSFKTNYSLVNQNLGILRASVGSSGSALIRNIEASRPTFIRPFSYSINEPNQEVQHQLASFKAIRNFADGSQLNISYARQWNTRKEFDVRRSANLPVLDLELETDDLQIEWEHSFSNRIIGSVGVQYFAQSNSNNPGTLVTPFIPNYEVKRYSAFIQESLELHNSVWEIGFRYDFEEDGVGGRDNRNTIFQDSFTFNNISFSLGHKWDLNAHTKIRNNLGFGWRPPNMAELYSFGQHESQTTFGLLRYQPSEQHIIEASSVTLFDESEISPENSTKYSSELEWRTNKNYLSVSAYVNYIQNFIFSRPIGVLGTARGPMPTFIIDQSDALFLGSDVSYTRYYHPNGKAKLGASYIWSRNVERNEALINQPPIHLHASMEHSFSDIGFVDELDLSIHPTFTFRQFQAPRDISVRSLIEGSADLAIDDPIFDFLPPPDGFFLLNATVGAKIKDFYISLEARNLLNTRYRDYLNTMRYFADEMGANFILSVNYSL